MNNEKIINLLDWLVSLDISFYIATKESDYDPGCNSHFYLKGSPERFSSEEIIKIYNNKMNNTLNKRWLSAIADYNNYNKRNYHYQKIK